MSSFLGGEVREGDHRVPTDQTPKELPQGAFQVEWWPGTCR